MTEWVFPADSDLITEFDLSDDQYDETVFKFRPLRETGPLNLLDAYGAFVQRDQRPCQSCVSHAVAVMLESYSLRDGDSDTVFDPIWMHRCVAGLGCGDTFGVKEMMKLLHGRTLPIGEPGPSGCAIQDGVAMPKFARLYQGNAFRDALDLGLAVVCKHLVDKAFETYSGGIYRLTEGRAGLHATAIIGYDDQAQTWLCRNSFGEGWGLEGNFRAAYRSLGIAGRPPGYCVYDPALGVEPWDPLASDTMV